MIANWSLFVKFKAKLFFELFFVVVVVFLNARNDSIKLFSLTSFFSQKFFAVCNSLAIKLFSFTFLSLKFFMKRNAQAVTLRR